MQEVWSFILRHWEIILTCLLSIISLVIYLIVNKKKIVVDDVFTKLLLVLPTYILNAESSGQTGEEKLKLVFLDCVEFLHAETNKSTDSIIAKYGASILSAIESILSTPQKK